MKKEGFSRTSEMVATLYGMQIVNYLLPLLTIPYLVRILGPAGLGHVAFGQVIGTYLCQWIEFGFDLSATRQIAVYADHAELRGSIAGRVLAAKAALAIVGITAMFVIQMFINLDQRLFWSANVWGISGGFSVLWYFQGLQRMKTVAMLDASAKITAAALLFVFVRTGEDAWKVLAVPAVASSMALLAGFICLLRDAPVRRSCIAAVWETLLEAWPLFISKASAYVSQAGSIVVLGIFQPAHVVGLFAAAEKIGRTAVSLLQPITIGMYPWLSKVVRNGKQDAFRLSRIMSILIGSGGITAGIGLYVTAPWIVAIVLGPAFTQTVPVVKVIGIWLALTTINMVLTFIWILPHGLEGPMSTISFAAAVINVVVTAVLAPSLAENSPAYAMVLSQLVCMAALVFVLRRSDEYRRSEPVPEPVGV